MSKNGLHTFAFHTEDITSERVTKALRTERPSLAAFATTVNLRDLDPETAARQHLTQALASEELPQFTAPKVNGTTCEFRILGTETLPLTKTKTVKFRQTYNKIPVYGSLITIEMDNENELLAVNSSLGEPMNVDTIARISPNEALNKVRDIAGYGLQPLEAIPRLCYYFDTAVDRWRLIYVIEDVRQQNREKTQTNEHIPLLMDYLIDAHNGEIVAKLPRTPNIVADRVSFPQKEVNEAIDELGKVRKFLCLVTEDRRTLQDPDLNIHTYDLEFQDWNSGLLPGNYVGKPPEWTPGAISAHANAAVVAIFLRDVLRRNGIDNRGGPLISSVNCIDANDSPDGQEWRNAAWVQTQMVYGQRRVGGQLRSYAVGLDVVAHEIFHGVTDKTSRIQYAGESGALNESYSDIFGIIVSNFEETDLSLWNWEMGEELEGTGIPLRDLSNPTKYRQPAHMRDYLDLPITASGDWGGVHFNSGIHNLAAYKIMTAKDRQGAYLFDSKSLAALFYITLTQYLSRTSLFKDSRRAMELVGRTLFRDDAIALRNEKLQAIARAFDAVGISISSQEQLLNGNFISRSTITRSQWLGNRLSSTVGNHYLVYVHGISQHQEHYSDSWWQALQPHVGEVFQNGNLGDTRLEVLWSHLVNTQTFVNAVNAVDSIKKQQLRREIMVILEERRRQELATNTEGGFSTNSAIQSHSVESYAAALAIDDFLIYMLNSRMRQRIIDCFTDIVKPLLTNNNQINIISHSWGTVVAYEGLRELEANEQFSQRYVSNFFTVGSALSIETVRDFLRPENRDGRRPSMVNKWINLDAKGDLIGGTLRGVFDINEETLRLNPIGCSQQWFGYDSVCAHNSYFVKENIAVNQEIFANYILM